MFSKKLINILSLVMAILLALYVLLTLVMWVWGYFGPTNLPAELQKVIQVLIQLGTMIFFYLMVAGMRSLAIGAKK
jgi:uncharacterized membrane protein YdjX (TVP38/TMEM64 family)